GARSRSHVHDPARATRRGRSRARAGPASSRAASRALLFLLLYGLALGGALGASPPDGNEEPKHRDGTRHEKEHVPPDGGAIVIRDANPRGHGGALRHVEDLRLRREPRDRALDDERGAAERERLAERRGGEGARASEDDHARTVRRRRKREP